MIICNEDKTECAIVRDGEVAFVLDEDEMYEIFDHLKKHDYDSIIAAKVKRIMEEKQFAFGCEEIFIKNTVIEVAELLDQTIDASNEINEIIRNLITKIATEITVSKGEAFKRIMESRN